jgi:hypothetical protein
MPVAAVRTFAAAAAISRFSRAHVCFFQYSFWEYESDDSTCIVIQKEFMAEKMRIQEKKKRELCLDKGNDVVTQIYRQRLLVYHEFYLVVDAVFQANHRNELGHFGAHFRGLAFSQVASEHALGSDGAGGNQGEVCAHFGTFHGPSAGGRNASLKSSNKKNRLH